MGVVRCGVAHVSDRVEVLSRSMGGFEKLAGEAAKDRLQQV